jgi:hypothetical protein
MNGKFTDLDVEVDSIRILSIEIEENVSSSQSSVTAEVYLTLGSKSAYMIAVILFDNKRSLG